jgi:hypothetical protein
MDFGDKPAWQTCQPAYLSDWRLLEREIITALKAQGHDISKNAVGEHCIAAEVNIATLAQALSRSRVVVRLTLMEPSELH